MRRHAYSWGEIATFCSAGSYMRSAPASRFSTIPARVGVSFRPPWPGHDAQRLGVSRRAVDAVWNLLCWEPPRLRSGSSPAPVRPSQTGMRSCRWSSYTPHDEMVAVIAKTALSADPNSFRVAREEHQPDDTTTYSRPGDVVLNLGDGGPMWTSRLLILSQRRAQMLYTLPNLRFPPLYRPMTVRSAGRRASSKHRELCRVSPRPSSRQTVKAIWASDERSLLWLKRFSAVCAAASSEDRFGVWVSHDSTFGGALAG